MLLAKNLPPLYSKKLFLQIKEEDKRLGNLGKLY
jgi:hypothetical protein